MKECNTSQKTTSAPLTKESWGAWEIDYATERKALIISVTDYHAGPLEITADKLRSLLRRLETDHERPQDLTVAHAMTQRPAPLQPDSPVFAVSRKDNCLSIEIPGGWAGQLKLARKDLYRYGSNWVKRANEPVAKRYIDEKQEIR